MQMEIFVCKEIQINKIALWFGICFNYFFFKIYICKLKKWLFSWKVDVLLQKERMDLWENRIVCERIKNLRIQSCLAVNMYCVNVFFQMQKTNIFIFLFSNNMHTVDAVDFCILQHVWIRCVRFNKNFWIVNDIIGKCLVQAHNYFIFNNFSTSVDFSIIPSYWFMYQSEP